MKRLALLCAVGIVLLGAAQPAFAAPPRSSLAVDFDRDGRPDVIAASADLPGRVTVLEDDGEGEAVERVLARFDGEVRQFASGDLDGDGWLDLVVVLRGEGETEIVWLDCHGTSCPALNRIWAADREAVLGAAVAADIDVDGDVDVALPIGPAGDLVVFVNDGPGVFAMSPESDAEDVVNYYRALAGLAGLALESHLVTAAQNHANYCAWEGKLTHYEDNPGNPYYTGYDWYKRAENAGYSHFKNVSENGAGGTDPKSAINAWMATVPHRWIIVHRDHQHLGFAGASMTGSFCFLEVGTPAYAWGDPVFFPGNGQHDVPTTYTYPEDGDPVSGDSSKGFPVTVSVPMWSTFAIAGVEFRDSAGASVPYYTVGPDASSWFSLGLIPQDPLRPGTTYTVHVKGTVTGKVYPVIGSYDIDRTWTFTTVVPPNRPPNTPTTPAGPGSGKPGETLTYTTSATDPDGDQVRYTFDWGDGSTSTTGLMASGATATAIHAYTSTGTYAVRAMATDSKGAGSGWSASLSVKVDAAELEWGAVECPLPPWPIGETVRLRGTYRNSGGLASPAFTIGWRIDRDGVKARDGSITGAALAPGASSGFDMSTGYRLGPGTYQVWLTLDSTNTVPEKIESNNRIVLSFVVPLPPGGVRNGGFETWFGYSWPAEWLGEGKVFRVRGIKNVGSAVRLGAPSWIMPWPPGTETGYRTPTILWQFLSVDYPTVSVMFYAYGGGYPWPPGPFNPVPEIVLEWFDSDGNPLYPLSVSPPIPPSFTSPWVAPWQFYQFAAYRPPGATIAKLVLMKKGTGFVVFDNVVVAGGPPY